MHWWVGILTLVIFLLTGAYMRWMHQPPVGQLSDLTRALYRSRHIYIMLGALANLALAAADRTNRIISVPALLAPVFLITAFFIEPERGIPEQAWSAWGLYALFASASLLALRNARKR